MEKLNRSIQIWTFSKSLMLREKVVQKLDFDMTKQCTPPLNGSEQENLLRTKL